MSRYRLLHQIRVLLQRNNKHLQCNQQRRSYVTPLNDPENKGQSQRGVNFDLLGTWDNRLDLPILLERSIKEGKPIPQIRLSDVGFDTVLGRRAVNEDRVKVTWLEPELLYVGIFDGHAGPRAVDYAWEFLDGHVQFCLSQGDDLQDALSNAIINVNNTYCRYLHYYWMRQHMIGEERGK